MKFKSLENTFNLIFNAKQLKELDAKFSEFENAATQREIDYKQIIEQQRLDSEQMKSFEKLKESNMEMRSVRGSFMLTKIKIN
jgi:hypothetical protein